MLSEGEWEYELWCSRISWTVMEPLEDGSELNQITWRRGGFPGGTVEWEMKPTQNYTITHFCKTKTVTMI